MEKSVIISIKFEVYSILRFSDFILTAIWKSIVLLNLIDHFNDSSHV